MIVKETFMKEKAINLIIGYLYGSFLTAEVVVKRYAVVSEKILLEKTM
ncbi:MAG: hypothetical protein IJF87_00530 [Erysipelotrichaceae bacterium]|nr:hypothetical protein [Erysipelotrichaceae bacterium]